MLRPAPGAQIFLPAKRLGLSRVRLQDLQVSPQILKSPVYSRYKAAREQAPRR